MRILKLEKKNAEAFNCKKSRKSLIKYIFISFEVEI